MSNYKSLSGKLTQRIKSEKQDGSFIPVAFKDENAVRRKDNPHDYSTVWRNAFMRDADKIINCPFYNRYADKTQVFSFYKNDDIAHRSLHVQLVSRTARTIGAALNLNLDLIEAIALGHDLGHTPFGHTGENILDQLYYSHTGRRFAHNIHSVRVLDKIFPLNVTLQTLDGIAAHNGELELEEYKPVPLSDFNVFDQEIEKCYIDQEHVKRLTPSTLEGCVVRISDIIAYLGKDRHDAEKSKIFNTRDFSDYGIGTINAEIVNNLIVNVIENSYGKNYIKMDELHFNALKMCKKENYDNIYKNPTLTNSYGAIKDMTAMIYDKLLSDLKNKNLSSPIYTHHVEYLNAPYYKRSTPYANTEPNQIVVDYVASMTDDYFIDLFHHLFPNSNLDVKYIGYFD
ncbi:MAG: HD domain-containing protein [Clostridia bacterium]|nr:HD domain-containing protein [Clostridia bacterium]